MLQALLLLAAVGLLPVLIKFGVDISQHFEAHKHQPEKCEIPEARTQAG